MPTRSESQRTSMQPFPFLDLKAQYRSIKREIDEAIARVVDAQQFILGPEVEQFEAEIAEYCRTSFAVGCASGSDALLLALMALEVGHDAGSIARLGARPVFVDIDPKTYNIDPWKLRAAVGANTKAIIPVHLFGMSVELNPILDVARSRNVPVIEDAAQAIGAAYAGRPVGGFGVCGCFSFFPSKNLGGAGDGGLLTSSDPDFTERLRILRNHGGKTKYAYEIIGMNSRLDALQAAILRVKLRYLDSWSQGRQRNAARYKARFRDHGLEPIVHLPQVASECVHIYNQYVIRVPRRDELKDHLRRCGVPCDIYYPSPLHLEPAFAYLGYKAGDFPVAEAACREVLALPIFPEMTSEQQDSVVESIAAFYRS
jgi:dTDP-4-amino-4,6-dideoxygalactose transaminase